MKLLNHVLLEPHGFLLRALKTETLDVERVRAAIQDFFGNNESGGGAMLHAVTREAAGVEKARRAGHLAQNWQVVRG